MQQDPSELKDHLSSSPPQVQSKRDVFVQLHTPNFLRVPTDYQDPEVDHWFDKTITYVPRRVTSGNEVTYLIDGLQTFRAMVAAIRTATGRASPESLPDGTQMYGGGHFIYLAGWFLGIDFELIPGSPETTITELFKKADSSDVAIRALLYRMPVSRQNLPAARFINGVPQWAEKWTNGLQNGFAIEDYRYLHNALTPQGRGGIFPYDPNLSPDTGRDGGTTIEANIDIDPRYLSGALHQKILIVNGNQGLIAFCGGVDINPDRIDGAGKGHNLGSGATKGSPMHDVHCRVVGPAAYDLLETFCERWKDQLKTQSVTVDKHTWNIEKLAQWSSGNIERNTDDLMEPSRMPEYYRAPIEFYRRKLAIQSLTEAPASPGRQLVQVGRTYGNGSNPAYKGILDGNKTRPYTYAPSGEKSVWRMIRRGIEQAQRFIYAEDQYFVSEDAAHCIAERVPLPHFQHVTMLFPHPSINAQPQEAYRAQQFLSIIAAADPEGKKVRLFCLKDPGQLHTYVHAKTWVFDDEFAIIGSANCNRRSYTHDSECVVGVGDQYQQGALGLNTPHRLRVELWAEHLFGLNHDNPSDALDPDKRRKAELVYAELADGVASVAHWARPLPQISRIAPYGLKEMDQYTQRMSAATKRTAGIISLMPGVPNLGPVIPAAQEWFNTNPAVWACVDLDGS